MFNESEAVGLQLGLTLQQIIDVVIIIPLPSAIYTFSSMNTFIYILLEHPRHAWLRHNPVNPTSFLLKSLFINMKKCPPKDNYLSV